MREPSDEQIFPDYDSLEEQRLAAAEADGVLVFRNPVGEPVAVPDSVVTEAERAYRCYKARIGGRSWEMIAAEERYPSAEAARRDVDRYMGEAKALVIEKSQQDMLVLEVARLDALQSSLWPNATSGHVPSAMGVLNIIKLRSQLVGLDPEKMANKAAELRTVVVEGSTTSTYIQELQRASERDAPPEDTVDP